MLRVQRDKPVVSVGGAVQILSLALQHRFDYKPAANNVCTSPGLTGTLRFGFDRLVLSSWACGLLLHRYVATASPRALSFRP